MSSAILYLAIIAIWAGFLVPAWVRRPHTRSESDSPESELSYASGGEGSAEAGAEAGDAADDHAAVGEPEFVEGEYSYYEVEYLEEEYVAAEYSDEYAYAVGSVGEQPAGVAGLGDPGDGYGPDGYGPEAPLPSQTRQQMLHARRRMLGILAAMTLVTMGFTALHLVAWWICIPPAGLLVLYVLLLREIAMADAELARKRSAWEHARAAAARQHMDAVAEREAYEASLPKPAPEPQAEIIDISGRVADADQLYDQYADAAARAVGD